MNNKLYLQVLLAIALGIMVGFCWPDLGIALKPLSDGFIKLIKMLIAPIVFCTVVNGMIGMQDMQQIGRVGIKALVYFEGVSTVALVLGLLVVHGLQPGSGMHIDVKTLDTQALASYTEGLYVKYSG
jgi:aerobic C4-dicarboxylate transport protein